MNRPFFIFFLLLISPSLIAASQIDKETKAQIFSLEKRIDGLDRKQSLLLKLESGRYNEIVHLLRDLRSTTVTLPAVPEIPAAEPAVMAQEAPETQPETIPSAATLEPTSDPTQATPEPQAVGAVPSPAEPPTVVAAVSSPSEETLSQLQSRMSRTESLATLSLLATALSLIAMVLMFKNLRQKEQNLKTAIWKTDMQGLREEVMMGRPHLTVEKNYDRITLLNKGSVAASDVQFSLGHAPATMKQKLKSIVIIRPNEKADVELGQIQEGQWHCKLEYKNAQNGRLYKDQFIMKVDGVTGEIAPIREAG